MQKNFFHLTKDTKIRKFGVYRKFLPSIYTKDSKIVKLTVWQQYFQKIFLHEKISLHNTQRHKFSFYNHFHIIFTVFLKTKSRRGKNSIRAALRYKKRKSAFMQTPHQNTHFLKQFSRNDFENIVPPRKAIKYGKQICFCIKKAGILWCLPIEIC